MENVRVFKDLSLEVINNDFFTKILEENPSIYELNNNNIANKYYEMFIVNNSLIVYDLVNKNIFKTFEFDINKFDNKETFIKFVTELFNISANFVGYNCVDIDFIFKIDKFTITLYIDKLIITNQYGFTHLLTDLYIKIIFKISYLENFDNIKIEDFTLRRGSFTYGELIEGYCHSHATYLYESGDSNEFKFCLGSSYIPTILTDIGINGLNAENFSFFLIALKEYLSWESIAGTPYRKIERLKLYSNEGKKINSINILTTDINVNTSILHSNDPKKKFIDYFIECLKTDKELAKDFFSIVSLNGVIYYEKALYNNFTVFLKLKEFLSYEIYKIIDNEKSEVFKNIPNLDLSYNDAIHSDLIIKFFMSDLIYINEFNVIYKLFDKLANRSFISQVLDNNIKFRNNTIKPVLLTRNENNYIANQMLFSTTLLILKILFEESITN